MKHSNLVITLSIIVLSFAVIGLTALHFQNIAKINSSESTLLALQKDMVSMRSLAGVSPAGSEPTWADVVAAVEPAVVLINVSGSNFVSAGSGFIIHSSGFVITNQHVIANAESITISLSTRDSYEAELVDTDIYNDMAILKMSSDRSDFPVIKLSSAGEAAVGDAVMAVGFPIGLELSGPATFTDGIVSAIREMGDITYIQTDAALNHGNSGGPLINQQGMVVGICTSVIGSSSPVNNVQGLGLAIYIGDVLEYINSGRIPCQNCHADGEYTE